MSVFSSTFSVFSTRIVPSSPTSSNPAVSVIKHGPSGKISMAFETGSVVVPGTSLTMAICCPVNALTNVDFPAFLSPKNAMWMRLPRGVSLSSAIGFKSVVVVHCAIGAVAENRRGRLHGLGDDEVHRLAGRRIELAEDMPNHV